MKFFNYPFFKDLEFDLNGKDAPSVIKYTTDTNSNFDKNSVYSTFKLFNSSTKELPPYNGDNNYTWEKLTKDLTKYALLANQENGAIGFRQHIPVEILEKYKIAESLRKYAGIKKDDLSYNLLLNGDFRALTNLVGNNVISVDNTIFIQDNGVSSSKNRTTCK